MNPDETTRIHRQESETAPGLTSLQEESGEPGINAKSAEPMADSPSEPLSWSARLRQALQRSASGEVRTNIKRQQLREDRTKAFLLLAGSTVVLGLMFFALFSSPSSNRQGAMARPAQPNLGRGPAADATDTSRSVTPLLNADTRNPNDDSSKVSAQDVQNTARLRSPTQAASQTPAPPPVPAPTDYALNRIQFPADPSPPAQPIAAPPRVDKLTKASMVFVSAVSTSATRERSPLTATVQPAFIEPQTSLLPAGTRLVARLQTPVSTAVKAPIVAAIEYNYERDGELVIPAGSKAFGELDQANDRGYVGLRFNSIQFPDGTMQTIDARAMGLNYEPLEGKVSGRNTGRKFLVRSLTGVGTILASTVGVGGGLGVTDTISNNVLLRERLADNVALAGEQQLNELAYRQNIVVTIPGNTRFYIVLAKPGDRNSGSTPSVGAPQTPSSSSSYAAASMPSVQELRELMELKQELTQMYQQQQTKAQMTTTSQQQQQ
jgi:Bacterial conjugation TrbI-like protein